TIDGALGQLARKDAVLVERFKDRGGHLQQEIAEATARRATLRTDIDAELLKRYESVRSSKGGVGVGRLENDACTACRMVLPAERVKALTDGPDIGICPACRRLLVVRAPSEA
ncbi:MAG: hypothetical protein Q8K99_01060, partial [Actinomycetota bacterium]|nr:hypothetical protein [Actinomycetota bacterium]